MTRLVDDLLDVSRVTLGKLDLRKSRIRLATAMDEAIEATRPLIAAASHELIVQYPNDEVWLDADPTRLSQILENLLDNAAKYTPAGGKIWLSAETVDQEVTVSVRDSGVGIAPENLFKIFEIFAQISPTLERSHGGLGIGLSLVRSISQLHGGSVDVASDGLGSGATFTVRLPRATGAIAAPMAPNALTIPAPGKVVPVTQAVPGRVVVIDDNEDAAVSLAMLLETEGFDVRTAFRGMDGVHVAQAFLPEVMIVDIGLPDINGYDVARKIRSDPALASRKLIALTGWGQTQDVENAIAAGFDDHFTKPADIARLLDVMLRRD